MTNDLVEMSDEMMPHMHTAQAFHAESALIPVARFEGGITPIAPASGDTLPGQDSFIAASPSQRHRNAPPPRQRAMPLNFTGDARRNRGGFEKQKFPATRMSLSRTTAPGCFHRCPGLQSQVDRLRRFATRSQNLWSPSAI